jgi:hypothetical protein
VALEAVRLLRLPGDHRALVSAETAELAERMGEVKRLDAAAAVKVQTAPSGFTPGSAVDHSSGLPIS